MEGVVYPHHLSNGVHGQLRRPHIDGPYPRKSGQGWSDRAPASRIALDLWTTQWLVRAGGQAGERGTNQVPKTEAGGSLGLDLKKDVQQLYAL